MAQSERARIALITSLTRWAREPDRAATQPVPRGFTDRFDREVDPDGVPPQAERTKRTARARHQRGVGRHRAA